MLRATTVTGDPRYRTYVNTRLTGIARMAAHMRANYPTATFDTYPSSVSGGSYSLRRVLFPQNLDDSGSMCAAMIKAHRAGIANLRPWIDNYANWVSTRQFRLSDGTFARNQPMPNSVWLDDLYMSVPCLAQMGRLTGDRRYFDDAAKQILQFHSRMFVPQNNLWMHGWIQEMSPHPAFHWARANGWALMATVELLTELPTNHPQRTQLLNILRAHAAGLRRTQAPSGLWHQLLDRPDSYEETSSSAMYVFALTRAINKGWLSRTTYGSRGVTRLEWRDDESEFDRPGRGHLHRHGSRLGRYVLSQSPDGRERGARLRANLPGGRRDHLPAPEAPRGRHDQCHRSVGAGIRGLGPGSGRTQFPFQQMIADHRREARRMIEPRHRRRADELPELAIEVRLVVVRLEMRAPLAWLLRTQPTIAMLETLDARELFGRHAHARNEAPFEGAGIEAVLARPLQDGLRTARRANPFEQ